MKLKIYNQSGKLKLTVNTSSSSTWNDELMTEYLHLSLILFLFSWM